MKKINKSNVKARALSATRLASLAPVRVAAFNSGVSRNAVIAATFAALGKKPVLALYNAGKVELQIGLMAAALVRKGDNRPADPLMAHCRDRLANYAGFGGTAKLREGQKGRRTKAEEDAYASARVTVSSIMKEAGVTVAEARGGNTSGTRKPQAGKIKAKVAANDAKPTVRKMADAGAMIQYAGIQAAALLANVNKNAKICPNALKSAVQDFSAAVRAIKA